MRWFWIDRFLEFERGRRAVQILLEQTATKDNAPSPRAEWVAPVLHARESTGIPEVA